jgi:hypothetical protein
LQKLQRLEHEVGEAPMSAMVAKESTHVAFMRSKGQRDLRR